MSLKLALSRRSGATYNSLYFPARIPRIVDENSASVSVLFRHTAGTPDAFSDATWSAISDINGEMTSVTPGRSSAGT